MKQKSITIESPEKITFNYTLSEIGTRIAAYMIDSILQGLIVFFIIFLLFLLGISLSSFEGLFNSEVGYMLIAFIMIMQFLLKWFYYVFFEVLMEGQTPGKKITGIRVITVNGENLDFGTIVLRNLLRVVDGFPSIPVIGTLIAMIDKKRRRLGDIVAGTMVVNEIYFDLKEPDFEVKFSTAPSNKKSIKVNFQLNENELYILRRFLNERYTMPGEKQNFIANNLANEIKEKLGIREDINNPIVFIERIYRQHGS